jgi:hypothetical protein
MSETKTTRDMLEKGDLAWGLVDSDMEEFVYTANNPYTHILGPVVPFCGQGPNIWVWDNTVEMGREAVFIGFTVDGDVVVPCQTSAGFVYFAHYCLLSRRPKEQVKPGDVFEDKEGRYFIASDFSVTMQACRLCSTCGVPSFDIRLADIVKHGYTNLGPFDEVYKKIRNPIVIPDIEVTELEERIAP